MNIRDRVRELRRVPASTLRPHPRNWRAHPPAQHAALRGVLAEIGMAEALVARELDDGSLQLIDGHLRAEVSADALVPVLLVDVNDDEALKLLTTLDPLAGMATADADLLSGLLEDVQTDCPAVESLWRQLLAADAEAIPPAGDDSPIVPTMYQVVAECEDESRQRALYERLVAEGWKCRLLVL